MATFEKNTILFNLVYRDQQVQVQTRPNQYYSLMGLIVDHLDTPGFGLCSGMGSCGTCVVEIDGIRNLSCEVAITDELANSGIIIPDVFR